MMQASQACKNLEWKMFSSCNMEKWEDLVPYPSNDFAVTKDKRLIFLKQNNMM